MYIYKYVPYLTFKSLGNMAKKLKMNRRNMKQCLEEKEVQLAGSLPMEVGVKCDIVCMRIRDGPSPPRVPSEF